jgi:3-oxoacyl-[acyl-carrier-protein] synthase II
MMAPASYQILGFGISYDALNITAPDETGETPALALRWALDSAACDGSDIGYINAHTSGTPLNDQVESLAMRKTFGGQLDNIAVSGTKGAIGHTLGAVALIEAIVACCSVEHGLAPGTVGLNELDPQLGLVAIPPGVQQTLRAPVAMSTTFGFGGANSSIIVTKNVTKRHSSAQQETENG